MPTRVFSYWYLYREARKLRYLFMYIFAYFMFSDAVSTISQMTTIITGEITSFSAVQITLQSLVTAITSIIGCLFFLWLSKRFQVKTKTNLLVIVVTTALVPVWGCFGISMSNFGIKVSYSTYMDQPIIDIFFVRYRLSGSCGF